MNLKKIMFTVIAILTICTSTFQVASAANYSFEVDSSQKSEKSLYNISDIVNSNEQYVNSTLAENWITNEKKFDYPIKPESDEWKTFDTHKKMVEACTIPDEIIEKMSTQELLEIVMNYPLLSDLYYYDTYEQGLYALVSEFNGLKELFKRDDGIVEILKYYEEYEIPNNTVQSEKILNDLDNTSDNELDQKLTEVLKDDEKGIILQEDFKTIANIELVETILVNDIILDSCNEDQKNKIVAIASKKYNDKIQSDLFAGKEDFIYDVADEVGNIAMINEIVDENKNSLAAYTTTYVTTPNGAKVEVSINTYFNGLCKNFSPIGLYFKDCIKIPLLEFATA